MPEEEVICGTAEVERIGQRLLARQKQTRSFDRRMPIGAEVLPEGGAHFRVWAPASRHVSVELRPSPGADEWERHALAAEPDGYFSGLVDSARAGMCYRLRLDSGSYPDPASRFQPEGPHGPSQLVDPASFEWTDENWRGVSRERQVIYEMHVGTFTREGTWSAAAKELPELARLGATLVEVMPVADFCGRYGWGYDGVNMFAPTRLYGAPDDFRAFVNRAHELGVGVILDVVYNHFGPDGNYIGHFSPDYFSRRYKNEWGDPINFDDTNSGPVREFFISNAGYWIDEFHLDGLRLDATQQIFDASRDHILAAVTRRVRSAARGRGTFIVGENEPQHTDLVRPAEQGGYGIDALWNDDYHHSAMVALTGKSEAYYSDHRGAPQEFISAVKWGYLFQGQRYHWQKARRGTPALDLHPENFVAFIQNHDQVANSLRGQRVHHIASPGCFKALTTLLLLGPNTPMLFQGQEFAASTPFFYFADNAPELARRVSEGRRTFLSQFKTIASPECERLHCDPSHEETFNRSKLNLSERGQHREIYELHRELLRLRREDPVFAAPRPRGVDGAVLGPAAFVLRFFGEASGDRLVVVNLGADLHLVPAPEPLLAPPRGASWQVIFSTDSVRYGGCGTAAVESDEGWSIPGQAAIILAPQTPDRPQEEAGNGKADPQN